MTKKNLKKTVTDILIRLEVPNYSVIESQTAMGWPQLEVKAVVSSEKQYKHLASLLANFYSTCTLAGWELVREIKKGFK